MSRIIRVIIHKSSYRNRREVNYCYPLFCYVSIRRLLNNYPDYFTHRLYFGEVETPYSCPPLIWSDRTVPLPVRSFVLLSCELFHMIENVRFCHICYNASLRELNNASQWIKILFPHILKLGWFPIMRSFTEFVKELFIYFYLSGKICDLWFKFENTRLHMALLSPDPFWCKKLKIPIWTEFVKIFRVSSEWSVTWDSYFHNFLS